VKVIDVAAQQAITLAKQRGAAEVSRDHLLLGCLYACSRFGVARLGPWTFDLEALGVDWVGLPDKSGAKVSYSNAVVEIFDRAARIARADGAGIRLEHLLVAFANEESGLMGKLKRKLHIESSAWRAAAADRAPASPEVPAPHAGDTALRDYLTPEEAAEALNIHVQTLRAYVRTGKLPALRLAGERAIRIRRADLDKVLEPLMPEK
jgi:excisionase family DNA binding protein